MRNAVCIAGLCAIVFFVIVGCARQTQIVKLYDDSASVSKTYRRFLVLDISSDPRRQKMFEDEIVNELQRARVEALESYPTLDASDGVLQGEIDSLSEEFAADAILVTHIAAIDTRVDIEAGREELISTCRHGDPSGYYLYDHKVLKEPDTVAFAHTVIVVTNLYDAATQKRVWSIQSTCFDKESMPEALLDESHAIVRQLKIDNLVK